MNRSPVSLWLSCLVGACATGSPARQALFVQAGGKSGTGFVVGADQPDPATANTVFFVAPRHLFGNLQCGEAPPGPPPECQFASGPSAQGAPCRIRKHCLFDDRLGVGDDLTLVEGEMRHIREAARQNRILDPLLVRSGLKNNEAVSLWVWDGAHLRDYDTKYQLRQDSTTVLEFVDYASKTGDSGSIYTDAHGRVIAQHLGDAHANLGVSIAELMLRVRGALATSMAVRRTQENGSSVPWLAAHWKSAASGAAFGATGLAFGLAALLGNGENEYDRLRSGCQSNICSATLMSTRDQGVAADRRASLHLGLAGGLALTSALLFGLGQWLQF